MFRREVRLAGDLVRRVEPGDTRRSGVVARHLDLIDRCLHHHHVIEDELVWPLLLARASNDVAPMVELMESQHDVVATLLARIEPRRARWADTADASGRDELAALYDRLAVALVDHLDDEESSVAADRGGVPQPVGMGLARRRRTARYASIGTDPRVRDDAVRRRSPRRRHHVGVGAEARTRAAPLARPPGVPPAFLGRPRHGHAVIGRLAAVDRPMFLACSFWRQAERLARAEDGYCGATASAEG